jgi:hypothetical protein
VKNPSFAVLMAARKNFAREASEASINEKLIVKISSAVNERVTSAMMIATSTS